MALYDINSGTAAVASDVEQLVNIFTGKHDIGNNISLPNTLSAPSSGSFSLATQAGNSLGVGAYNYQFSYVTGQYKSDGVTLVKTGETLVSSALSITTTSGNTNVLITLPTASLPTSLIAINVYRTSVGGSDYKLIATVKAGSVNYQDSTSDASRSSTTPPASNTTGTIITMPSTPVLNGSIVSSQNSISANVETILKYSGTWINSNGVFFAPYTGTYLFNCSFFTNFSGNGASVVMNAYKNGSFIYQLGKICTPTGGTGTIDTILQGQMVLGMSANDQLYFSAINTAGGSINTSNSLINIVKTS